MAIVASDADWMRIDHADLKLDAALGLQAHTSLGRLYRGTLYGMERVGVYMVSLKAQEADAETARHEAAQLALTHPSILRMRGVAAGTMTSCAFILTEWMENGSLHDVLRRTAPDFAPVDRRLVLSDAHRYDIAVQLALGVRYLHALPEARRPSPRFLTSKNVLMDERLQPKIGGLGFACVRELVKARGDHAPSLAWTAPELLLDDGRGRSSLPGDIFAMGMIVWELFTGLVPYKGETEADITTGVRQGDRLPIPDTLTVQLRRVIEAAWHQDPKQRPSAHKLAEQLFALQADQLESDAIATQAAAAEAVRAKCAAAEFELSAKVDSAEQAHTVAQAALDAANAAAEAAMNRSYGGRRALSSTSSSSDADVARAEDAERACTKKLEDERGALRKLQEENKVVVAAAVAAAAAVAKLRQDKIDAARRKEAEEAAVAAAAAARRCAVATATRVASEASAMAAAAVHARRDAAALAAVEAREAAEESARERHEEAMREHEARIEAAYVQRLVEAGERREADIALKLPLAKAAAAALPHFCLDLRLSRTVVKGSLGAYDAARSSLYLLRPDAALSVYDTRQTKGLAQLQYTGAKKALFMALDARHGIVYAILKNGWHPQLTAWRVGEDAPFGPDAGRSVGVLGVMAMCVDESQQHVWVVEGTGTRIVAYDSTLQEVRRIDFYTLKRDNPLAALHTRPTAIVVAGAELFVASGSRILVLDTSTFQLKRQFGQHAAREHELFHLPPPAGHFLSIHSISLTLHPDTKAPLLLIRERNSGTPLLLYDLDGQFVAYVKSVSGLHLPHSEVQSCAHNSDVMLHDPDLKLAHRYTICAEEADRLPAPHSHKKHRRAAAAGAGAGACDSDEDGNAVDSDEGGSDNSDSSSESNDYDESEDDDDAAEGAEPAAKKRRVTLARRVKQEARVQPEPDSDNAHESNDELEADAEAAEEDEDAPDKGAHVDAGDHEAAFEDLPDCFENQTEGEAPHEEDEEDAHAEEPHASSQSSEADKEDAGDQDEDDEAAELRHYLGDLSDSSEEDEEEAYVPRKKGIKRAHA